jgi:hypothetical protein
MAELEGLPVSGSAAIVPVSGSELETPELRDTGEPYPGMQTEFDDEM